MTIIIFPLDFNIQWHLNSGIAVGATIKHHSPTPVAHRPASLREGGYKIDIRGAATEVIKQMGLWEQVKKQETDMKDSIFVNAAGRQLARFDAQVFGFRAKDDVEVMRGDLSKIIYEATRHDVEYIFDDSIRSMTEQENDIYVEFHRHAPRSFNLVLGADGSRSHVRNLVFGKAPSCIHDLGHYVSIFSVPNFLNLDRSERMYAVPGKVISLYKTPESATAKAMFIFSSNRLAHPGRDIAKQKQLLNEVFGNIGWESNRLLSYADQAPDFYFDTVSQVNTNTLWKGRTALLGDAGYSPSLASGQGTSLTLVGAYVLAGELCQHPNDHAQAFCAYENEMHTFIEKNLALGRSNIKNLVPASRWKMRLQVFMINTLKYVPWKNAIVRKIGEAVKEAANAIHLKNYAAPTAGKRRPVMQGNIDSGKMQRA